MFKTRFISMLVLLAAVATGAVAQTETLLITIESKDYTSFKSGSKTFDNKATVSFSSEVENDDDNDGWYNPGWDNKILSVAPAAGYTITKVKFYNQSGSAFDETSPFEATLNAMKMYVNGSSCGAGGVTKIEVYGYAAPAAATYTVTLKEGTEDATSWTIAPPEATTTGVAAGTEVKATYGGTKKVKSVKAVKKAPAGTPLDNTTTAWTDGNTFAVPAGGLTYSDAVTVSGAVTLILTDGTTLTLNKGISLASGATLTVQGTGTMNVNGTNGADNNSNDEGASGGSGTAAISGSGTLVLTSGTVTAIGGNGGNVSDYMPECKGGHGAAAISCTLTVNGGTLTATGGNGGSLTNGTGFEGVAGNGGAGISGALTVNGGTLTATGGNRGAKSSGPDASDGNIGRGVSSTWTAGTGITFSDSADGTTWTANSGTSSTQKYVKAE